MKKTLLILSALLVLALGVSLVGAQSGLPGSGWETGQQIQNIGSGQADAIAFVAVAQNGTETNCGTATNVAAGASANFLTGNCAIPAGFVGSAIVSSDQPIAAIVNVNNRTVGKAAGQYKGTDSSDVAMEVNFPLVKNNFGGRTSTFYVQNASDGPVNVTATFVTVPGGTNTETYNNVPAGAMVVIIPADAGVPTGGLGSLNVSATGNIAGAVLESEHGVTTGNNLQAARGFTAGDAAPTIYCPLVRNGHTARNQTTGIQVQNVSGAAQTITVTYSYNGDQTKVVTSPSVADGASFTFFGADATYGLPTGALGSAKVEGENGDVIAIVNDRGFALSPSPVTAYACFPETQATQEVVVPLYKEYFFGNTSGIQVQNVGDGPTTVTLVYQGVKGNNPVSATVSHSTPIPAGQSATFFGVSQGTAPAGITGVNANLVNSFGGITITSDNENIVVIANESSFGGFGTTASGQDTKNFEGFNQ